MMKLKKSDHPVEYEEALAFMDAHVQAMHEGRADELVWLLEHPPLYTGGTSAREEDLLHADFPVYKTGRGGEYTYHGPGQRVAYVMLDLKKRQQAPDIKAYVSDLEEWIIRSLARFDIQGERREGRIGIWVPPTPDGYSATGETQGSEKKIAAFGVRVRHWITLHGVAINVDPDLSHFGGIVPCGIKEYGVTSMRELLGREVSMAELDDALQAEWGTVFG